MINALKLVGKSFSNIKVVANGAGAAGIAIIKLLYSFGVRDMIMCDSRGAIYEGRTIGMNEVKEEIAKMTNKDQEKGDLEDVLQDADVFIGDRKSTRLNSSHVAISYAVFCLKNKTTTN